MTAAETCHVLRSLEIDRRALCFEQALALLPPATQGEHWSIVVFGVDTLDLPPSSSELRVVAVTRRGRKLEGYARAETVSASQHYLGLLCLGPPTT